MSFVVGAANLTVDSFIGFSVQVSGVSVPAPPLALKEDGSI
jgi:hypothetical protein